MVKEVRSTCSNRSHLVKLGCKKGTQSLQETASLMRGCSTSHKSGAKAYFIIGFFMLATQRYTPESAASETSVRLACGACGA